MRPGLRRCLTLRNQRAEIARMHTWTEGLAIPFGLSQRTLNALQLCLEEAVNNIISHAFAPGSEHHIRVAVWRDGTTVHAEVVDDGAPFDPLAHAQPGAPTELASAPIVGAGIKLMRSFAERIAYRRADGTNRLLLSFPAP